MRILTGKKFNYPNGLNLRRNMTKKIKKRTPSHEKLSQGEQNLLVNNLNLNIQESPFPSPEKLSGYKNLYPDSPKIFFDEFQANGKALRRMVNMDSTLRLLGLLMAGFYLVASIVIPVFFALKYDNPWIIFTCGFGLLPAFTGSLAKIMRKRK